MAMNIDDRDSPEKKTKRLKILIEDLEQQKNQEKITVRDLLLLLDHYKPLRENICELNYSPTLLASGRGSDPEGDLPTDPEKRQILENVKRALDSCTSRYAELQAASDSYQKEIKALQSKLEKTRAKAKAEQAQLVEIQRRTERFHPALAALRSIPDVARQMELANLPPDPFDAMIRTVAVLAQRDNLERLWDALADQANRDRAAPGPQALEVLSSALDWYNQNWKSRPWLLDLPKPDTPIDFHRHQRAPATPTGETIVQVWLPSVLDGSGKIVRKALVITR